MSAPAAVSVLADYLRAHKQALTTEYAREARNESSDLRGLPLSQLVDHFPEFLGAFADWIEGRDATTARYVEALAEGHALQRLSIGFDLGGLVAEYAAMRRVLMRHLLSIDTPGDRTAALLRVDEGLDRAIWESVRRYSAARDKLRDRFLGILGHDLRSPLQSALLSARLVERGGLDQEQLRAALARVVRGVTRMNGMVGDLLEFARAQMGGTMPVRLQLTDMGELCRTVVDEAQDRSADRAITYTTDGDLRGHWDPERVRQAVANLLSNAMEHGTGPVTARAFEGDGGRAVYTVVQNPGQIPEAQRAQLFEPYTRQMESGRKGLGLGLFIVQQIVLAHGGTCTVDSNAEVGTRVTLRWPREPIAEVPER
jgi:signal transduction histidine kinase